MPNGVTLDELKTAKTKLVKKGFLPVLAGSTQKRPLGAWSNYKMTDWKNHLKLVNGVRANVGIVCGVPSSIIVLDIDNKKPIVREGSDDSWYSEKTGIEDWTELCKNNKGEPDTLKCTTPSGGLHYYFLYDDEFAKTVKTTNTYVMSNDGRLCAIDLRGDGGFVMTPPSQFMTGQYCWQPTDKIMDVRIAPMPEWIKDNIIVNSTKTAKVKDDNLRKRTYTEVYGNDIIDKTAFDLFKTSPYYKNHTIFRIDEYHRIILQEPENVDIECEICERTHIKHTNHPFLVRRNNDSDLLFVCRSSSGDKSFVQKIEPPKVKSEEETKEEKKVEKDTPHFILMNELWKVGHKLKLTKRNGWIYKPFDETKICAYKPYMKYEDFINKSLRSNKVFLSAPKRFKDIMLHLDMYDDVHLPKMKVDRNYLAFQNGVLNIRTLQFLEYKDKILKGVVARNYIDQIFTKKTHTPVFDSFVMYQIPIDDDASKIFKMVCALIGRLFFLVGEHDNMKVALLLYGESNTGKSTLINIIKSFFQPNAIGVITSNFESTFGLDSIYEKDIILIPDMPHNMAKLMDPTLLQNIIDGDHTNIPGKHMRAQCEPVRLPIVAAGNIFPQYDDKKGAQVRRWVTFVFDNFVQRKDTKLERTIIENELPNLIYKCLCAYWDMVKESPGADFWDIAPVYFHENKEIGRVASNWLHRFLTAAPDENKTRTARYYVRKVKQIPRFACPIEDVKKNFDRYMKFNHEGVKYTWDNNDYTTFKELGYEIQKVNICKSCSQKAKGGSDKCCENYHTANRVKRVSVLDMEIVCEAIEPPTYTADMSKKIFGY